MKDKKRAIVSLLLLGLIGLLGCHQDEPEAVELAKREHFHAKQLFTDRASLLYAQQELGLADAQALRRGLWACRRTKKPSRRRTITCSEPDCS